MANFHKICYFPALCKKCYKVVQINMFEKPIRCPECKSDSVVAYNSPELQEKKGKNEVISWNVFDKLGRELSLNDGKYLCPVCGKFSLRFLEGGLCWD